MSLGNLITLADFYSISTDCLLCRTELRKHKNQSVSALHLNDDAIQILTDKNIIQDYYPNYSHMKISKMLYEYSVSRLKAYCPRPEKCSYER